MWLLNEAVLKWVLFRYNTHVLLLHIDLCIPISKEDLTTKCVEANV
jgi:hypothetical protein